MRREDAAYFADVLKIRFPWLGTDEEVQCCDAIEELSQLYEDLLKDSGATENQQLTDVRLSDVEEEL